MPIIADEQLGRLREAVRDSYRRLEPFRRHRLDALRQYVGHRYSDNGNPARVYANFLELAVSIYVRSLVSSQPRVLVRPRMEQYWHEAYTLELDTNELLEELDFRDVIRRWVHEAMFSVAYLKVGLTTNAAGELQPFADPVDLDNWVQDMQCRTWSQVQFCGDRYTMPLATLRENPEVYDEGVVADLKADEVRPVDGETGEEQTWLLASGESSFGETFEDVVLLWDIWLPRYRTLLTFAEQSDAARVLRAVELTGPVESPYHRLAFEEVPGNAMPLPPAALWAEMSALQNDLFDKMADQARRQKTVLGVHASAAEDADRIVKSEDGDVIKMTNPQGMQERRFGGLDQPTLAFALAMKQLYSYMAGNLDALGGLAAQAETLGQEKLLAGSASQRLSDMQDCVVSAVRGVCRDLAWYRYSDQFRYAQVYKPVLPEMGIGVYEQIVPGGYQGRFSDFKFDLEPYSLRSLSPAQRLQMLTQVLGQYVMPALPMLAQQGRGLDFDKLLELVSRYLNLPELQHVLKNVPVSGNDFDGGGNAPSAPTQRNYTRTSVPQPMNMENEMVRSGLKNRPATEQVA
jgi:hypothetical protein